MTKAKKKPLKKRPVKKSTKKKPQQKRASTKKVSKKRATVKKPAKKPAKKIAPKKITSFERYISEEKINLADGESIYLEEVFAYRQDGSVTIREILNDLDTEPNQEDRNQIVEEGNESLLDESISGDSFDFLTHYLLRVGEREINESGYFFDLIYETDDQEALSRQLRVLRSWLNCKVEDKETHSRIKNDLIRNAVSPLHSNLIIAKLIKIKPE